MSKSNQVTERYHRASDEENLTMDGSFVPSKILLVGSIPLASTREVFIKMSHDLPQRLYALPDGETGSRNNWIRWQLDCFPRETLKYTLPGAVEMENHPASYTLESIKPTNYDKMATESYVEFKELRSEGLINPDLIFQVCLPMPLNPVQSLVRPEFHEQLEPLYEERFREALIQILAKIPAIDLAIQWDLTYDVMALEYERGTPMDPKFKPHFFPIKKGIHDRIARQCALIPFEVKLGFHLCYGDFQHKHFIEPVDLSVLVDLANDIVAMLDGTRSIEWIHMPVPQSRTDAAYFLPLNSLNFRGRLYLGLVHANDEAGTLQRIRTASSVYQRPFGVATECGMGRTPTEELDSILKISKDVTAAKGLSVS